MRFLAIALTATFVLAAGTAWACPMHEAHNSQTVASSGNGNSTPIPPRQSDGNG